MRGWVYPFFLAASLLAACAHVTPPPAAPQTASVQPPTSATTAPVVPANQDREAPAQPGVRTDGEIPAPISSGNPLPVPSAPKPPVVATARKKPTPPTAAATSAAATAPKPTLDFQSLVQRLRDTSAVGVFTKLSIKNQVDDLLKAFRGYYAGQVPPSLDDLRQRYDGLLLKVVSLVQDGDASLASSISASRGAIWDRLSNRDSFQSL